ncbi:MAG: trimethylamine corrinoid protein 2 [Vallitaleaceae bacterium]|nr:trimethylamine corrinoid protein 2 [Vallitaleaceae bacterium]
MRYKQDWENTQNKFMEFWARENHDRPLINISAPKENKPFKAAPSKNHSERWLDTEYVIARERANMENTFYGLEAYPMVFPNLGPDFFGATFGADIIFEETTSYSVPFIQTPEEFAKLEFKTDNKWWQKMVEMTEAFVKDAGGDYFVGITDLHPGADGLVSLRGPEHLCMDLYDHPEAFKKGLFKILPALQYQLDALYEITQNNLKGSTNWMGIWHPEKWYVTSSDFICMISEDMFEEFIIPELVTEIDWLAQRSIFHLDGPGALKHLDRLLEIPNLAGVQWVYGAGQPSAAHWMPTLKKIQDAGKCIVIEAYAEDVVPLSKELKPEGVYYHISHNSVKNEEDAKAFIKLIENSYKKTLF